MPIYEYECSVCANRFEVMQRFSDEPVTQCGICGGRVQRVLSPPALVFRGSGWYVTEHPSRDRSEAAKRDKDQGEQPGGERSSKDSKSLPAGDRSAVRKRS
jgi:putative FmdB family regulatory protein